MKKFIIVLTAALLLILLSACGSSQKPTPAPTQEPTAAAPAEPTAEPTEVPAAEPAAEPEEAAPESSSGGGRKTLEEIADDLKAAKAERMYGSTAFITINTEGKKTWTAPLGGIEEFKVPEFFTNAKGGIQLTDGTEVIEASGLVWTNFEYMPCSEEDYRNLVNQIREAEDSEDETIDADDLREIWEMLRAPLFTVYGISENRGEAEIKSIISDYYLEEYGITAEDSSEYMKEWEFTPAGSAEDFNFFLVKPPAEELYIYADDETGFKEEYLSLREKAAEIIPLFTFYKPYGLTVFVGIGTGISFETSDLYGNPVKSADLFGKQNVTMVNLWGTFCGFCISEMPELVKLNKEFEAKGAQIVGIVYDAETDDLIAEAKDIVEDINIDFVNLLPNDTITAIFQAQSFPCSYFVNSKGEVLGEPVLGADFDKYRNLVDEYLAAAE